MMHHDRQVLSSDPYMVLARSEMEQRWRWAAQERLAREARKGRASAEGQSARPPFGPSRLRRLAGRVLGLAPAPGVS